MLSCTIASPGAGSEVACCRLAPFHRDPAWLAGQGGRREVHCRRVIVDAIFYLVDNGIKWRALPVDFPSWSTVYNYFAVWEAAGVTQRMLDSLRERVRLREARTAEPSAAIVDSQPVKAAEAVGKASRGCDAGKKTNGRKRHIAVDTLGLLLCVLVTTASVAGPRRRPPVAEQAGRLLSSCPPGLGRRWLRRQTRSRDREALQ